MPDDDPGSTVRRVEMINESSAYAYYGIGSEPRGMTQVHRTTWASHDGYWPPHAGDVIDSMYGTLKRRPRS